MHRPKGGRLLQIEKPLPRSCSLRTAATADGRNAFSVVTSVPSTSVMTSLILLNVFPFRAVSGRVYDVDAVSLGDDDRRGAADKEAAIDDTDNRDDPLFERFGIGD